MLNHVFSMLILGVFLFTHSAVPARGGECATPLNKALQETSMAGALKKMPKGRCALEKEIVTWTFLRHGHQDATFYEYENFLKRRPGWPWQHRLYVHAEKALLKDKNKQKILAWFEKHPPKTFEGVVRQLDLLLEDDKQAFHKKLRDVGVHFDMNGDQWQVFVTRYAPYLDQKLFKKRAKACLIKDDLRAMKHVMSKLDHKDHGFFTMIYDLKKGDTRGDQLYGRLSYEMRQNPEIRLAYLTWLRRQGHLKGLDFLKRNPQMYHHTPKRTWQEANLLLRRAIQEKAWEKAIPALYPDRIKNRVDHLEASWLLGWLLIQSGRSYDRAKHLFEKIYAQARTPISQAKYAFWAGVACEKAGHDGTLWFQKAAAFPWVFYGQCALEKQGLDITTGDPAPITITLKEKRELTQKDLGRACRILSEAGQNLLARDFWFVFYKQQKTLKGQKQVMAYAQSFDTSLPLMMVKEAGLLKPLYLKATYPLLSLHEQKALGDMLKNLVWEDPLGWQALVHAVIHKESRFHDMAISPRGALGLMQIMPKTGLEYAERKKLLLKNSQELLNDRLLNIKVGSHYLHSLLKKKNFDLYLALASYNAGPGRVASWETLPASFHDLPVVARVNALEGIPYAETRHYIQRVIETSHVYAHILRPKKKPIPKASQRKKSPTKKTTSSWKKG